MPKLIIIGAGGLGQEIAWAARLANDRSPRYEIAGFADDDPRKRGQQMDGLPVLGPIEEASDPATGIVWYVCGIGNNRTREALVARAQELDWLPATVIDPSVVLGPGSTVGEGSYIAALTVLAPHSRIGQHVIINHGCSIGHDSKIGAFGQVCPGGRISGFCVLGRGAFVGSNGVLAPSAEMGDYSLLGAASFSAKTIPPGATAVGNPARIVFQSPLAPAPA